MRYVLALLLVVGLGEAQNFPQQTAITKDIKANSTACDPGNSCAASQVRGASFVGIQVTGTWVATLQFEGTIDCSNWFSVQATPEPSGAAVSNTAANGQWSIPSSGYCNVRVRASAYTSGTATVTLRPTTI